LRRRNRDSGWSLKFGLLLWANALWLAWFLSIALGGLGGIFSGLMGFFGLGWPFVQLAAVGLGFWWAGRYTSEGCIFRATTCCLLSGGAVFSLFVGFAQNGFAP
jgi:hypothetical protein